MFEKKYLQLTKFGVTIYFSLSSFWICQRQHVVPAPSDSAHGTKSAHRSRSARHCPSRHVPVAPAATPSARSEIKHSLECLSSHLEKVLYKVIPIPKSWFIGKSKNHLENKSRRIKQTKTIKTIQASAKLSIQKWAHAPTVNPRVRQHFGHIHFCLKSQQKKIWK